MARRYKALAEYFKSYNGVRRFSKLSGYITRN